MMEGICYLYFKILMLTAIRDNALDWMYKKLNTELQYLSLLLLCGPGEDRS